MATLLPPERGGPALLPSPPRTPSPPPPPEADLGTAFEYDYDYDADPPPPSRLASAKGKGRAADGGGGALTDAEDVPLARGSAPGSPAPGSPADAYPPMSDDDAETRRIEENLRRWETAERQRRKLARDAAAPAPAAGTGGGSGAPPTSPSAASRPSLSSVVSALWRRPSSAGGADVPLAPRASTSSSTRTQTPFVPMSDDDGQRTPTALSPGARSPFGDDDDDGAGGGAAHPARRGTLMRSESSVMAVPKLGAPPTPRPLGLPAPRSPPPADLDAAEHASIAGASDAGSSSSALVRRHPPEPRAPPDIEAAARERERARVAQLDEHGRELWWTDWLCGVGRGGDRQAGRTNPFE